MLRFPIIVASTALALFPGFSCQMREQGTRGEGNRAAAFEATVILCTHAIDDLYTRLQGQLPCGVRGLGTKWRVRQQPRMDEALLSKKL